MNQPNNTSDFFTTVIQLVEKSKWSYVSTAGKLRIDVPNCETLLFSLENGEISGFIKYWGEDQNTLEQIFMLFRVIKPYFKQLQVDDDFGLWHNYISQFSKDTLPTFRELRDIEKEELERWFDLPQGSDSVFGMSQSHAVLMFMICKDMNSGLIAPITLKDLLFSLDERCKQSLSLDENNECFQLIAIAETWFLTKLHDNQGNQIKWLNGKTNDCTLFGWLMAEIVFGFGGGSLGSKHQKLHRFVDSLHKQNIDFDNPENFLRLIYSVIEYLKAFRPDMLIIRRKP